MPLVERRYAEALINISVGENAIDSFRQDFEFVTGIYDNNEDFKLFLLDPQIKTDTKKTVIKNIFEGKVKNELLNFLMLLLDKGRIKSLPGMLEEFNKMADKRKNILNMIIISALPLEESQINEIKQKYKSLYNATEVEADLETDPNLIGGVKVKVGDKVTDGSIKGRIEALKQVLQSN